MKDLNFFSSYNKKTQKNFDKALILYCFIVLSIIGIIIYSLFNYISIKKLNNEVEALRAKVEAGTQDKKIKEILDKEQQLNYFKNDMDKLRVLNKHIDDCDIINEYLLEDIRINIPPTVFISSMVISNSSIRIECKSKDKESIAQFEYNISKIEDFEQVFIPNVTVEQEYYSFNLDIKLKEEETDGSEAEKK